MASNQRSKKSLHGGGGSIHMPIYSPSNLGYNMPGQGGGDKNQKYYDVGGRHKSIDKQNDLTKIYMV